MSIASLTGIAARRSKVSPSDVSEIASEMIGFMNSLLVGEIPTVALCEVHIRQWSNGHLHINCSEHTYQMQCTYIWRCPGRMSANRRGVANRKLLVKIPDMAGGLHEDKRDIDGGVATAVKYSNVIQFKFNIHICR